MGFLDGVPVLNDVEDGLGTVGTGLTDSLIADPGNALLGVNAGNMGIFEENAAGQKAVTGLSLGTLGEGGLISDVLMPGQGDPGEQWGPNEGDRTTDPKQQGISGLAIAAIAAIGSAILLTEVL